MELPSKYLCLLALTAANSVLAAQQPDRSNPTATITNGTISGVHSASNSQDFFLGIPYAQPPVESLRFRNPESLNTTYDDILQAHEYSPSCVGYGADQTGYPVSEDCLTLNVIRPCGYEDHALPVGIWIHGGDYLMGGSRDRRYNLSFIVSNSVEIGKPFIGVSLNYRLDAWGFLSSREVSGSGNTNLGLKDQRLALHWVQENIHAFGGDPKKVTIWGESAGAQSVGYHITAFNGRDDHLFQAAIMQSGNPVNYNSFHTTEVYQPAYDDIVNQTNCSHAPDTLSCLRTIPFPRLNSLLKRLGTYWQPIIDGDFLARWTSTQLAQGAFVRVPIIAGATTDEATQWIHPGLNTSADFRAYATSNTTLAYLPPQFGDDVLRAYPDNDPENMIPAPDGPPLPPGSGAMYRRTAAYETDFAIAALRRGTCETWAAHGIRAYSYRFDTPPANTAAWMGVPHFAEVAFVFDNTDGLGYDTSPFDGKPAAYEAVAGLMSRAWAGFIHDPYAAPVVGGVVWPEYSLETPRNLVWDARREGLVYVEADTFRARGIWWILEHALNYKR